MSDGDPTGVFRRGHMPALYRRRFFSQGTPPVPPASFTRRRGPPPGDAPAVLPQQLLDRRRFTAPALIATPTFARRRAPPLGAAAAILPQQQIDRRRFSPARRKSRPVLFTVV